MDSKLITLQKAVQAAVGPVACAWSAIVEDKSLQSLPADEVADVLQRSIVLLGNVNGMLTQVRRQLILEAGDKEISKLTKDDIPQSGKDLFGTGFTELVATRAKESKAIKELHQELSKDTRRPFHQRQPFRRTGSGPFRGRAPTFSRRFSPYQGQSARTGYSTLRPNHRQFDRHVPFRQQNRNQQQSNQRDKSNSQ